MDHPPGLFIRWSALQMSPVAQGVLCSLAGPHLAPRARRHRAAAAAAAKLHGYPLHPECSSVRAGSSHAYPHLVSHSPLQGCQAKVLPPALLAAMCLTAAHATRRVFLCLRQAPAALPACLRCCHMQPIIPTESRGCRNWPHFFGSSALGNFITCLLLPLLSSTDRSSQQHYLCVRQNQQS